MGMAYSPPAKTKDVGPAPKSDRVSIILIVASNALTLAIALVQRWPLVLMLWPFWIQSVVIGYYSVRRILSLERFSTDGFTINDVQPEPTRATQRKTAAFFAMHFGLFHFVYLVFLGVFTLMVPADASPEVLAAKAQEQQNLIYAWATGLIFVFTHGASFRRNRAADERGKPNIGTLMFLPYARVVPMHVMVILALPMNGGAGALLLFGAMKTVADVIMHVVEHRVLGRTPKEEYDARKASA
jgi:hypothetical protein